LEERFVRAEQIAVFGEATLKNSDYVADYQALKQ